MGIDNCHRVYFRLFQMVSKSKFIGLTCVLAKSKKHMKEQYKDIYPYILEAIINARKLHFIHFFRIVCG